MYINIAKLTWLNLTNQSFLYPTTDERCKEMVLFSYVSGLAIIITHYNTESAPSLVLNNVTKISIQYLAKYSINLHILPNCFIQTITKSGHTGVASRIRT